MPRILKNLNGALVGRFDFILLGAILVFRFLARLYEIRGRAVMVDLRCGSSCKMDQCFWKIRSIFLNLVWKLVVNLNGCVGGLVLLYLSVMLCCLSVVGLGVTDQSEGIIIPDVLVLPQAHGKVGIAGVKICPIAVPWVCR